ncbi:MAG TPA: cupredoxin domain-containing protein [Solirubrobacterales bacterium]|jgi:plastocyanin|nr:cupredoxin domain-containing protein [Solirubrobacterales bacterium]
MKLKALLAPALIVTALALAACGSDGGGETSSGSEPTGSTATTGASGNDPAPSGEAERSAKVEIVEFTYGPDPVTVQAGGKAIWLNQDTAPHTATADDGSFDTGVLERGKLKSETFKQAGTFTYHCEIHPTMHGTVKVVEKD